METLSKGSAKICVDLELYNDLLFAVPNTPKWWNW